MDNDELYPDGRHYDELSGDDCFLHDSGDTGEMVAMFCDFNFIGARKCCDTNEDLNLR